jgi:hypothetical protein
MSRWAEMAARALANAASLRVTAAYAAVLLAVSVTLTAMGPHARAVAVSQMSTNLHNLAHGRVATLVGSAFVNDGDDVYWLPGLVCLLALGEIIWRSTGLVVAFAVGHIGATVLVAVGLIAAVENRWVPVSVARATDVGISYGAVCILGALTASISARWRPAWIGWWLGVAMVATWGGDFTAAGHVLALLLGIGLSSRLPSIERWTPWRVGLLVVGGVFGYLVMSGWFVAAPAGLATALAGHTWARVARRRNRPGVRPPDSTLGSLPERASA